MKQKTLTSLAMVALVVSAFGCTKTEEATGGDVQSPQVATTAEMPGMTNLDDLNPAAAQSYIDSVKMGHGLGLDGSIAADKADDNFTPGQPIHLAMTVKDAPADAAVKVVWYGPNETKIVEEQKKVPRGATTLAYSATDTSSWAKGDYRADIWIGDEKVSSQQFRIVDLTNAGT